MDAYRSVHHPGGVVADLETLPLGRPSLHTASAGECGAACVRTQASLFCSGTVSRSRYTGVEPLALWKAVRTGGSGRQRTFGTAYMTDFCQTNTTLRAMP